MFIVYTFFCIFQRKKKFFPQIFHNGFHFYIFYFMQPYHSVLFLLNTVFFPIYEYPGLLCINKEGLEYTGIRYGMERIKGGKNMVDRCVCCGAIVPEGTEVCINCRHQYLDTENGQTVSCPDHSISRAQNLKRQETPGH